MHIDTHPLAVIYLSSLIGSTPHTLLETSTNPMYTQKLTSIPFNHNPETPRQKRNPKLNIYLVANEKALSTLDRPKILHTLRDAFTKLEGAKTPAISLNLTMKDPQHIDNSQSYTYPYPETPTRTCHNTIYPIGPFQAAWNPNNYIYTDGSQKRGNPTLGASIVNPSANTTTHIDVKSQPERHTINRAELTAITLTLELYQDSPQLHILREAFTKLEGAKTPAISLNLIMKDP